MRVATQNANECLNGEIWRRCPKTQWLSRTNIMIGEHNSMHINLTLCKCFTYQQSVNHYHTGATMGVLTFNCGREQKITEIQAEFGLVAGAKTLENARKKDERRMAKKTTDAGVRKSKKQKIVTERQRQITKEGVTYAAGKFGA